MRLDRIVFECDCHTILEVEHITRYTSQNTCPRCGAHIRVTVASHRKTGLAVFVNVLKHKPTHKILYQEVES